MANIIKEHMLSILDNNVRADGRKFDEYRKIDIEYEVSESAEGSARVKIGDTEVVVGVKMEIGKPFPDNLDEGTIMVNAELRPFASPDFVSGPPGVDAIELARVVDRILRESRVINFKELCIKQGESMWTVVVDIYPINDAGNLFDASSLCALAALQDVKYPKVDENNVIDYKTKTNRNLPLNNLPLGCTVIKIGKKLIVDPTETEEKLIDARLTVGVLDNGNLCALQKGGNVGFDAKEISEITEIAIKKTKEIRKVLKK